jgi:hypothetical protein
LVRRINNMPLSESSHPKPSLQSDQHSAVETLSSGTTVFKPY